MASDTNNIVGTCAEAGWRNGIERTARREVLVQGSLLQVIDNFNQKAPRRVLPRTVLSLVLVGSMLLVFATAFRQPAVSV